MPTHPSWSFLIENPSGTRVLFDLGIAVDWRQYAPVVSRRITTNGWHITADRSVADIIEDAGVPRESINSIIWSHHHWDHIGDPTTFPPSTELVVGPGFVEEYLPGWPTNETSFLRDADIKGRKVREISFDESLVFGNLRAYDFFGDGSFYLLDTPGHSVGHLSGLVRTTKNPDTFIFMGGDLCHHAGEVRPSKYKPLPNEIAPEILPTFLRQVCPGAVLEELLTSRSREADQSFFDPRLGSDIPEAIRTIGKVQEADANENVLFLYAHDTSLLDGMVDLFPQAANNWKKNGWRAKLYWHFLGDFREALELLGKA
ncbi:uncharacterized protein Z519_06807 [Cladophialophora bantiana CBS 173.52]|uniref:Metallo-beta-lactamase domain-containing protein n=1 Tax=Cladophialophora bantiana (strain ATCC 10958 / CBS 173.52 / CDC B-1940 / NIH 8579) TaxID=1442370 RepID=A0A0D2HI93_CLAB1|nr:uncharacterized protein Z519_06807 [Cladophialophora bantiana CBS 173.52]KIW92958.1 hypothetical protein Z519_06807 [Cladophialophora bantiana CBS 173.52]